MLPVHCITLWVLQGTQPIHVVLKRQFSARHPHVCAPNGMHGSGLWSLTPLPCPDSQTDQPHGVSGTHQAWFTSQGYGNQCTSEVPQFFSK